MKCHKLGILGLIAVFVFIAFPACAGDAETREWYGNYSGPNYAAEVTAKTQAQWQGLWERVSRVPPAPLDTARDMGIGIFLGTRRTGGYEIVVLSAKEEEGSFVVRYREIKPEGFVTQALTTPYLIKILPKTDLPVIFKKGPISHAGDITITIAYDNIPHAKDLIAFWGYSCFIEGLEKNILFDTGSFGIILLSNMSKLKIDPKDIDIVVLSHAHPDHTRGLWSILKKNDNISVYLPQSFPKNYKDKAAKMSKGVTSISGPVNICKNVWSTGELGIMMKEQSLVIETEKGLIVVIGCGHPGVVEIARFSKTYFKKDIYLLMGGFHFEGYGRKQMKDIINDLKILGVKKVAPSHCTGEGAMELFRKAWGEDFIESGCGAELSL